MVELLERSSGAGGRVRCERESEAAGDRPRSAAGVGGGLGRAVAEVLGGAVEVGLHGGRGRCSMSSVGEPLRGRSRSSSLDVAAAGAVRGRWSASHRDGRLGPRSRQGQREAGDRDDAIAAGDDDGRSGRSPVRIQAGRAGRPDDDRVGGREVRSLRHARIIGRDLAHSMRNRLGIGEGRSTAARAPSAPDRRAQRPRAASSSVWSSMTWWPSGSGSPSGPTPAGSSLAPAVAHRGHAHGPGAGDVGATQVADVRGPTGIDAAEAGQRVLEDRRGPACSSRPRRRTTSGRTGRARRGPRGSRAARSTA